MPHHYDYTSLDEFLKKDYDPRSVARELDETMSDLVEHAGHEENYSNILPARHFLLRSLRDIFFKLTPVER